MCLMVSIFKGYVVKPPYRESHSFEIGVCFINQSVNQALNTPVRVDAFTAHLASHWIDRWKNKIYEIKIMYIKPKWLVIWGLIEKKNIAPYIKYLSYDMGCLGVKQKWQVKVSSIS